MERISSFGFGPLTVHRIVTGPVQENAYIVVGAHAPGVIVDPGADGPDILKVINGIGAKPEAILVTHAHFDHIGAVERLRRALGIPAFLHPDARAQWDQSGLAAARWNMPFEQPGPPEGDLMTGTFEIGGLRLEVLPTPGHAPGHVSLYARQGFVIAGDALFKNSIGRTDLPGGDHALLLASIRTHLLSLPPETVVLSGHGLETTILAEAQSNPFLQ